MTARADADNLATLSEAELARTLEISPAKLADIAQTILQNPSSTIEPASARADSLGRHALAGLGEEVGARAITGGLDIERTIGEGGMGIVRLATQRSLGRQVAVKTLRPEAKSEVATLRLLREAWVTGSLEHPNIVPVYDLGLDDDGSPVIVLKRIEGAPWSTLVADAKEVRERFGSGDLLEYNLRILIQLCHAVSLAHARGVLHRDLKPENVMIGRFGEVYLVDWGIAVSLRPDSTGRLPLATEATEMAGTPAYMAPEMLGAMGALSERTDVYLLGAVLHEILTGSPPHSGANFREIAVSILLSSFDYPEGTPRELVEIAKKAMRRDAAARFASADELRTKLEWYLRHRGSLVLSDEAGRRLDEMAAIMAHRDAAASRDRLYALSAEARFGFRQALVACNDNEEAREGLRRVIETMVSFELDRGTPEAAAAALAELDSPPPELAERVRVALAKRAADNERIAELEVLGAELDPSIGRRTRLFVAILIGVFWTISPEVIGKMVERSSFFSRRAMYAASVIMIAACVVVVRWARDSMSKTAVNRRVTAAGMLMFAGQLVLELGANLMELPILSTMVLHVFLWFVSLAAVAAFIERKLWPSVPVMAAGFLFASAYPAHVWVVMSSVNFVLVVNFFLAWRNPEEDRSYGARRFREQVDALKGRLK